MINSPYISKFPIAISETIGIGNNEENGSIKDNFIAWNLIFSSNLFNLLFISLIDFFSKPLLWKTLNLEVFCYI